MTRCAQTKILLWIGAIIHIGLTLRIFAHNSNVMTLHSLAAWPCRQDGQTNGRTDGHSTILNAASQWTGRIIAHERTTILASSSIVTGAWASYANLCSPQSNKHHFISFHFTICIVASAVAPQIWSLLPKYIPGGPKNGTPVLILR